MPQDRRKGSDAGNFSSTLKERRYLVSGLSAVSKGTGRSPPSKTMFVTEAAEAEVGPDG